MAEAVPERPAGVPEGGFWNPELGSWEVSRRTAQGARDGECLFYRPDGSLQSRCTFVNGVQEGTFAILHPDGRLAREGTFAAGKVEGIVSAYAGEGAGAEPLRACCVPAAAVRLDQRYEGGAMVQEIFYDSSGQPILSDGRPIPPRPAGVPDDADYDEAGPRWTRWRPDSHRSWSAAGMLETESEHDGLRRTTRTFDTDGRLVESCQVSHEGTRDGAFLRRFARAARAPTPMPPSARSAARSSAGRRWGPGPSWRRRHRAAPGGARRGVRSRRASGPRRPSRRARTRPPMTGARSPPRCGRRGACERRSARRRARRCATAIARRSRARWRRTWCRSGPSWRPSAATRSCSRSTRRSRRSSTGSSRAPIPRRRSGRSRRCCRGPTRRRPTSSRRRCCWRPSGG